MGIIAALVALWIVTSVVVGLVIGRTVRLRDHSLLPRPGQVGPTPTGEAALATLGA
jgi:hypothetical protein